MDLQPATADPALAALTPTPPEAIRPVRPAPRRRPPFRAFVQLLRRLHLYAGLLMLPWVVLYGVTAFLFNHPTAFSDQPTATFGADALRGTPLEAPPPPAELAGQVVAGLQKRAKEGATYTLVEPEAARFNREAAFATVRAGDQEVSVLLNVAGTGGTVRSRTVAPRPPKPAEERAPFAVGTPGGEAASRGGRGGAGGPRGGMGRGEGGPGGRGPRGDGETHAHKGGDALKLDRPLAERVAAAVPVVLERTGFPTGEVTVTSVPDLLFRMSDGEKVWAVTYNPQAGSVAGRPADAAPPEVGTELSARRFLQRLHTAHGYPGEFNARWVWAVIVDGMAFIMVFWGLSGLLMWWQIKATRLAGAVTLVVSAAGAAAVGYGMHELLATAGR